MRTCHNGRSERNAPSKEKPPARKGIAAVVPVIGIALLPKCPACAAGYLGVLGSLGVSFTALQQKIGLGVFLLIAIGSIALGIRRCGYGPLSLGLFAAVGILVSKFYLDTRPLLIASVGLLVVAAAWNTMLRWRRFA